MGMTPAPPRPRMWLSLPPGFFPSTELDEGDRTELLASLTEGLSEPAAAVVAEAVAARLPSFQRPSPR